MLKMEVRLDQRLSSSLILRDTETIELRRSSTTISMMQPDAEQKSHAGDVELKDAVIKDDEWTEVKKDDDRTHEVSLPTSVVPRKETDTYSQVPLYDDAETKRIIRKIDIRLMPLLTVLYLLSFLDRSNIGNARIAGMDEDLNLTGSQYNIATMVSGLTPYVPYWRPLTSRPGLLLHLCGI